MILLLLKLYISRNNSSISDYSVFFRSASGLIRWQFEVPQFSKPWKLWQISLWYRSQFPNDLSYSKGRVFPQLLRSSPAGPLFHLQNSFSGVPKQICGGLTVERRRLWDLWEQWRGQEKNFNELRWNFWNDWMVFGGAIYSRWHLNPLSWVTSAITGLENWLAYLLAV